MEYTDKYIRTLREAIELYNAQVQKEGEVAVKPVVLEYIGYIRVATNRLNEVLVKQESMEFPNIEEYRRYFLTDRGFASLFMGWLKDSKVSPSDDWGEVAEELKLLRGAINEKMVYMAKILVPRENGSASEKSATEGQELQCNEWAMTDEQKSGMVRYIPKKMIPTKRHFDFLVGENAIDVNMSSSDFSDAVMRAYFTGMYEWAGKNKAKTKLRAYVHKLGLKYFEQDYLTAAANSIKINKKALGKHDGVKDFECELSQIL